MVVTKEETYHALLMEYASGCLDEAQALIVATHLSLSPDGRKIVADYESIGGSLLQDCCGSVAMKSDALKCVMDKIEKMGAPESCTEKLKKKCGEKDLPTCLESHMESKTWKADKSGHHFIHVKTTCCGYTAQLMKIAPDTTINETAVTVVLEGSFGTETAVYQRGDLVIVEHNTTLRSHREQGAVCFIVRPAQSKFKKFLSIFYPKD